MATTEKKELSMEELAKNLVTFAVDRDDVKELLTQMPESQHINLVTVEYELQILKIVSTGWGISFYLEDPVQKETLSTLFWEAINQFSKGISEMASITSETGIDYFEVVKERMDAYVKALYSCTAEDNPVNAVGPAFADHCGLADEVFTIRAGSRMFQMTLNSIKEYLDYVKIA